MPIMDFVVRESTEDEAEQVRRLGQEAFGMPTTPPSEPATLNHPGTRHVAAFDGEVMAASMVDRAYDSWFGGRLVPTSGIGGVTVALEYRGRKLLTPLFAELFRGARERGAVISTLFASSIGIYRRLGYEVIGSGDTARIPLASLGRLRVGSEVSTRRATARDVPAVREIYDRWAAAQNGPLSRRGVSFSADDEKLIKHLTGLTLAERDGVIIGYASWDRGSGFGAEGYLKVHDLLAVDLEGYRALLSALSTYASVVDQAEVASSGIDLFKAALPTSDWRVQSVEHYMLKIIDVAGALSARGYPTGIDIELEFGVRGDPITDGDGRYRLQITDGSGQCERVGDLLDDDSSVPVFTPNGLSLAYAGTQSAAGLRTVSALSGPDHHDETWGAVFGGRPFAIHDHF
jgi:predicted acetyltransferase